MILQHETQLERIVFPLKNGGNSIIEVGINDVESIRVQMQNGQMAPVPWFEVIYVDGRIQLWNAHHCEGITLVEIASA
jgi:hypothetical protein